MMPIKWSILLSLVTSFFCFETPKLIKRQSCHHIEIGQLIYKANQLSGFYMIATLALNDLILKHVEQN